MAAPRNKVSLATAKTIPFFLAMIVGYCSYAFTGPLAIEYLLNPPKGIPPRISAGIALLLIYYLLLIPVAATWLRLLIVVWRDPGYIPSGSPRKDSDSEPAPGLEEFWDRDVFVCDSRGLPIWCAICNNWKLDRTHHNQDVGRCTRKMDHFCPWVGGVVGERSFKFFVQFNFYSFLLSAFAMSGLAYFVAEKKESSNLEVQWLIALGLAGFFCLFTMGMVMNGVWMVLQNVTTIENIEPFSRTLFLAVLLPPELQNQPLDGLPPLPPIHSGRDLSPSRSAQSGRPLTSEIDDPSHSSYNFSQPRSNRPSRRASILPYQERIWKGTVTYPLHLPTDRPPLPAAQPRTFAILESLPGMNIWDLGSSYLNFKAVFGDKLHDWLLPIKHSPCCDHTSLISQYPLGPDFQELLVESGLMPRPASLSIPREKEYYDAGRSAASQKRRRRKRRLDTGWQNGERPNGWMSEKEARRIRNEARRSTHAMASPSSPANGRDAVR